MKTLILLSLLTSLISVTGFASDSADNMSCVVLGGDGSNINFTNNLGSKIINRGDSAVLYQAVDSDMIVLANSNKLTIDKKTMDTIAVSIKSGDNLLQHTSVKFGEMLSISDFQRNIGITCISLK